MHAFHLEPSNATSKIDWTGVTGAIGGFSIEFAPNQSLPVDLHAGRLIKQKNSEKKFFYGIELTPNIFSKKTLELNYTEFGSILPVFTSIVWLGQVYWNAEPIECSDPIKLAKRLSERTMVISHFSAYRLHKERLHTLLALNPPNILAVRGDAVDPEQDFSHSDEMVTEIRRLKGDNISIGVAGYPQGHPSSENLQQDIQALQRKVECGADYIITQICFSTSSIIEFVKSTRALGIKVPIVVGIIVPHSMRIIQLCNKLAHVDLDESELELIRKLEPKEFLEYFIDRAVKQITEIMAGDVGIYGFQFYTMNHFENVKEVLKRLHQNGIIEGET